MNPKNFMLTIFGAIVLLMGVVCAKVVHASDNKLHRVMVEPTARAQAPALPTLKTTLVTERQELQKLAPPAGKLGSPASLKVTLIALPAANGPTASNLLLPTKQRKH